MGNEELAADSGQVAQKIPNTDSVALRLKKNKVHTHSGVWPTVQCTTKIHLNIEKQSNISETY